MPLGLANRCADFTGDFCQRITPVQRSRCARSTLHGRAGCAPIYTTPARLRLFHHDWEILPALVQVLSSSGFKLWAAIWYENGVMEKIDPQPDHEKLAPFRPGQQVIFRGKPYTIQRRTTLASGEAAVVLQGEKEQFSIPATEFLAGVQ